MLLHLTTLNAWTTFVRGSSYRAASLETAGFIHLSAPEQVAGPASALFGNIDDVWLLVIDPARLAAPLRWEPGDPGDPGSMHFPHLYGPLEIAAVTAVVPYRRSADGAFGLPDDLPAVDDAARRARAMEFYVAAARSTSVRAVGGGIAVRHGEFPFSYDHNRVVLRAPVVAAEAEQLCRAALGGLSHWQVGFDGPVDDDTIGGFRAAGWTHAANVLMVALRAPADDRVAMAAGVDVREVDRGELADFRTSSMRRNRPAIADDGLRQLLDRVETTERVVRVLHLAVLVDGLPAAQLDLRALGATAEIDDVVTDPAFAGRGFATALLFSALEQARKFGCDVVFLRADTDDWPRQLYERLGFGVSGAAVHVFDRDV